MARTKCPPPRRRATNPPPPSSSPPQPPPPPPTPLPPLFKRNPIPLAGLRYQGCTAKELREYVDNRRPGTTFPNNNKKQLKDKLRRLDAEWNFRLIGLPPELRNFVYHELLKPDSRTGLPTNCNIVVTSRLVHREAEPILYALNTFTIDFESCAPTLFNDRSLRRIHHRIERIGLADEYAGLPRATCLKVQHLILHVDVTDEDEDTGDVSNRRTLALANVLGGSSSLKTVDIHVHRLDASTGTTIGSLNTVGLLYPLAKLQITDAGGQRNTRTVTFHFDNDTIKRALGRQMAVGTPRPVDAIGALAVLQSRSRVIIESMEKLPPFDEELDVFVTALEAAMEEHMLELVVDHEMDSLFCRKVKALGATFDKHEERWRKCISNNMWEAMHGAQGGVHFDSVGDANGWLEEQWITFQVLRIGQE